VRARQIRLPEVGRATTIVEVPEIPGFRPNAPENHAATENPWRGSSEVEAIVEGEERLGKILPSTLVGIAMGRMKQLLTE
jgi:hypothetical protein